MQALEKIILALVVVFCTTIAVQSLGIKPPARAFPLFVSILTGTMAAVAFIRAINKPLTNPVFDEGMGSIVAAGTAGLVVYIIAMSFSYIAATLVFLFAGYVFLRPDRTPRAMLVAAGVSIAATAFTWLCFSYWLGVNLP